MNTTKILLALAAFAPVAASAQSIDCRLRDQHVRIVRGVRDGELTRGEARSLERREALVRAQERIDRHFDRDRLTYGERRGLERELNRNRREIFWDKHDGRRD